jgi:predicted lipoprotein with Yx(FWY)xxD motif
MHPRTRPRISFARSIAIIGATLALALGVLGGPVAQAQSARSIGSQVAAGLGSILTDGAGRTLYMFTKDAPGISNCYDQCATAWPPLTSDSELVLSPGIPGVLGSTQRTDGTAQLTYNGMPLYYWVKDQKPGDTTGQNVGGVWFVINPTPAQTVSVRSDQELGDILVDARGMTLYLYTRDEPGQSNCYNQCATAWPPLLTDSAPSGTDALAAGLGTTERNDGTQQVTYNDVPLYYWVSDKQPGDTTGQNVGGVWFIVNP